MSVVSSVSPAGERWVNSLRYLNLKAGVEVVFHGLAYTAGGLVSFGQAVCGAEEGAHRTEGVGGDGGIGPGGIGSISVGGGVTFTGLHGDRGGPGVIYNP